MAVVIALIGGMSILGAAVIGARRGTKRDLAEIHVLVNSRLTDALNEIRALRNYIDDPGDKHIPPGT